MIVTLLQDPRKTDFSDVFLFFHFFGTSKHGAEKALTNNFFAIPISTLERFYRANKKNMSYIIRANRRCSLVEIKE